MTPSHEIKPICKISHEKKTVCQNPFILVDEKQVKFKRL